MCLTDMGVEAEQCIPKAKEEKREAPDWFNDRCREARDKKITSYKRWNRHGTEPARERFVQARNEYTDIRREEARKFEKGIVEKSVEEPKILYAHINSKMKVKNKLQRLIQGWWVVYGTAYSRRNSKGRVVPT